MILKSWVQKLKTINLFPEKTNVTFAQVLDRKNINVNVWERGAGQTKSLWDSCLRNSNCCLLKGLADKSLYKILKKGVFKLTIKQKYFMTGQVSEIKKIDLEI